MLWCKWSRIRIDIRQQRHYLLLVLLFLFSYSAFAKESYLDYHRSIIDAEEKFLKGDRPGSLTAYKQVFDSWERPFARDCFVALQICCLEKDTTLWKYFLGVAFKNGVSINTLNFAGVVNQFIDSKVGRKEYVDNLYKSARLEFIRSIDFNTRAYLLSLAKADDIYKSIPREWRGVEYADSVNAILIDKNTLSVMQLFKKQGYKGERSLGIIDPDLDGYRDKTLFLRVSSGIPIFFYHSRCLYFLLQEELRAALDNGEIHPKDYAIIYEWAYESLIIKPEQNGMGYYKYSKVDCSTSPRMKYYNMYLDQSLAFKNTKFVDSCRAQIGIPSTYHEELKKSLRKKTISFFFLEQEGVRTSPQLTPYSS